MIERFLEIRDRATCIPALAWKIGNAHELTSPAYSLLRKVGFHHPYPQVFLMRLSDQETHCDPHDWGGYTRTMPNAHNYIELHFDTLVDGDVIDVEYILGETTTKKEPEWMENL